MSSQPFSAPGVSPDLRRDETVHQIVDSLEYLDKIANEVFSRIHSKVEDNKSRLQKLNDHVNNSQARIDKIKGSKKATKVFATSKYPAQEYLDIYQTVFPGDGIKTVKRPNYHVQSRHRTVDDNILRDKLQYYSVKQNNKKKSDGTKGEGLGGLPKTIPSVSSLLLFNTTENP